MWYSESMNLSSFFLMKITKQSILGFVLLVYPFSQAFSDSWRLASEWAPHPRCIEALDLWDKGELNRYNCDRFGEGLEVFNGSPTDGIFAGYTYYRPKQDDGRALGDGYYGYQRVGDFPSGLTLLRTYENPGGNAVGDGLMLVTGLQGGAASEDDVIKVVSKQRFGNRCASGISNVHMSSKERYRVTFRATPLDFMAPGTRDSVVSKLWAKAFADSTETNEETDASDSAPELKLSFSANHCLAYMVYEGRSTASGLNLVEVQIDLPVSYWEQMSDQERCLSRLIDHLAEEKQTKSELFLDVNEYGQLKSEFFKKCQD